MIDSTGRSALRADGTILDLVPVGRAVVFIGGLLVALFTIIKPEASHGLGSVGRLLFWSLHVGHGLFALWLAGRWLANGDRLPNGTLAAVIVTGCAAILIAAPGYVILDGLFAAHITDLNPDPASAWPMRLATEVVEFAPWVMLIWLLINLPVLLPDPGKDIRMDDTAEMNHVISQACDVRSSTNPAQSTSACTSKQAGTQRGALTLVSPVETGSSQPDHETSPSEPPKQRKFLLSLPGVVGTDVIAVSSDLHYLNVWTVAGRSTVLGNLRDVVADLGDAGLQVHRSHWVAHAHVRRIVGTASNASCILSNELRIPISRRRWKTVRERFGRGVVHTSGSPDRQATFIER